MLFFAEMWERFSYYGMRALLLFYMIKGFLGMNDGDAYKIYGAYTALVYMTPYFGGMIADRILGRRRAVVLGGLLMAAGHLLMGYENKTMFFVALAFLIVGNGFFKPNISTIVGELYKKPEKKDAGFTLFYMGINLGAAMSPIICGYVGEVYGWHFGFGLATGGMLVGVAVFTMPTRITQLLIGGGAVATSIAMLFLWDSTIQLAVRIFMGIMLIGAATIAVAALQKGPLPAWAGAPPSEEALTKKVAGLLRADWTVYIGAVLAVGVFAFIVQEKQIAAIVLNVVGLGAFGYVLYEAIFKCNKVQRERLFVVVFLAMFHTLFWSFFEQAGTSLNNWTDRNIDRVTEARVIDDKEVGTTLTLRIPQKTKDDKLKDMALLTQEQLGHAMGDTAVKDLVAKAIVNVETGRNAKRDPGDVISKEQIDSLIEKVHAQKLFTMTGLNYLRNAAKYDDEKPDEVKSAAPFQSVAWKIAATNVGMGVAMAAALPASEFQAANPVYILLFGLLFTAVWTFLSRRERDPTPPVKFALGLAQLGLSFMMFYWGAQSADSRGMTSMTYLLLGYLLLTTGELCISPVGLSMVTKLAPKRLVSTVMGVWFVSITYANYFAAIIATITGPGKEGVSKVTLILQSLGEIFTGGGHSGAGGLQLIPPPQETVQTYGEVFGLIGKISFGAAIVCFLAKYFLNGWMHPEVEGDGSDWTPDDAKKPKAASA